MKEHQERKLNAVVQLNDAIVEFGDSWSTDESKQKAMAIVTTTGLMLNSLRDEFGPDLLIVVCAWLSIECEKIMSTFAEEGIKDG